MNALDELYRNLASQNYATEILIAKLDLVSGSMFRYVSTMGFYQSGRGETMRGGYQTIFRLPSHGYLKESLGAIGTTYLSASTNNTVYPGQQLGIKLEYKNVQKSHRTNLSKLENTFTSGSPYIRKKIK